MQLLVPGVLHAPRQLGRRLRLQLDEAAIARAILHVVRVVALGAGEPALLAGAGELADALAVDAIAPVAQLVAVALATQELRLVEADRIAEVVDQLVALRSVCLLYTSRCV